MTDFRLYLGLLGSFFAGVALGALYFGGLWLTVRRLPGTQRPARLLLASHIVRLTVSLLGIYLVTDGQVAWLAACLAGFILCRSLLIRRLGRTQALREVSPWKS